MWAVANKLMLLLTFCVCAAQMALWYVHLPDPIPSHFDANGQADRDMAKGPFYALMGLVNAMFLIGFPLLSTMLRKIPDSMINLPNKQYWLAPQRRDATLATTAQFLIATGWISVWLMIGIFHLTAEVATGIRESINPEVFWILGIYLGVLAIAMVWICLKFKVPKDESVKQLQEN